MNTVVRGHIHDYLQGPIFNLTDPDTPPRWVILFIIIMLIVLLVPPLIVALIDPSLLPWATPRK